MPASALSRWSLQPEYPQRSNLSLLESWDRSDSIPWLFLVLSFQASLRPTSSFKHWGFFRISISPAVLHSFIILNSPLALIPVASPDWSSIGSVPSVSLISITSIRWYSELERGCPRVKEHVTLLFAQSINSRRRSVSQKKENHLIARITHSFRHSPSNFILHRTAGGSCSFSC